MCDKCKNKGCQGGCSPASLADMQSQIDSLMGYVDTLNSLTKFLKGHPVMCLEDPADIVQFDLTTGKGTGDWIGWGICDGSNYPGPSGNIRTLDFRDRFPVGSQGTYAIGDTGGLDSVTLIVAELATHSHGVTDPGHTHIVTDPGHDHVITDPGHTHAGTASPHFHTFTTDADGAHTHTYLDTYNNQTEVGCIAAGPTGTVMYKGTSTPGSVNLGDSDTTEFSRGTSGADPATHTHTGNTDMATVAIVNSVSFTGITEAEDAFTGISIVANHTDITINNEGSNQAHENRPPYLAVLFVKKIY